MDNLLLLVNAAELVSDTQPPPMPRPQTPPRKQATRDQRIQLEAKTIEKYGLLVALAKNMIQHVLLNLFNVNQVGCFGVVSDFLG